MSQMQGIVSILGSDNPEKTSIRAGSLRRTLSADMSSKMWLAVNNGSPLMKKIASSEQIAIDSSSSSSESDEEDCEHPRRIDIWTAIMSQKKQDYSPPYVHPLVKKSASSLSEKSLKVCTESLGSETGSDVTLGSETPSDVFSSHPSSGASEEQQEEHKVVKPACLTTRKAQLGRSFPPPLPSLAAAHPEGPSLHMHSRRVDGRLVLEAVSVPQQKYFEAQRQDGRFLLTFINNPELDQPIEEDFVEEKSPDYGINNEDEDEDDEDEMENNTGILKEPQVDKTGIVINVHRSAETVKKMSERDNENPWWSQKQNTKVSKVDVVEEDEAHIIPPPTRATGLPPLPPPSAGNFMNSYQYLWRAKPTVASVIDSTITQHRPPTKTKELVLLRGNKAVCSFIPSLKGCIEPRRSLAMWVPFCIATS